MREIQQSATADQFVSSLDYPIGKAEILRRAREVRLADDVVGAFDDLPEREYESAEDLTNALNAA